ncbi:hypothetical protein KCP71_02920 [Salmonella enterica subsp. enterica]|nr:hypothetical protein KCP71_02920 [Salmonella enterica subsp. enterica]
MPQKPPYRMIYGKNAPDPLHSDFLISLDINTELLFTHAGWKGFIEECASAETKPPARQTAPSSTRVSRV